MSEAVMRKHIDLYVNNYSLNLGEDGREAIEKLLSVYKQLNPLTAFTENIFLADT